MEAEHGWLDIEKVFPLDDKYYLATMHRFETVASGHFKHIAKISLETGKYTFLTAGEREVTEILSVDLIKRRM